MGRKKEGEGERCKSKIVHWQRENQVRMDSSCRVLDPCLHLQLLFLAVSACCTSSLSFTSTVRVSVRSSSLCLFTLLLLHLIQAAVSRTEVAVALVTREERERESKYNLQLTTACLPALDQKDVKGRARQSQPDALLFCQFKRACFVSLSLSLPLYFSLFLHFSISLAPFPLASGHVNWAT